MLQQTRQFQIGQSYYTRSGAVVKISYINPDPIWRFIVATVERRVDGEPVVQDKPCKISLCPDGHYFPRDEEHPLDLMGEVRW